MPRYLIEREFRDPSTIAHDDADAAAVKGVVATNAEEHNPDGSFADWNTRVSCERQELL